MKIFRLFALGVLLPLLVRAELPPSAYESLQAKAPECVQIDVLSVMVTPGEQPDQRKVQVVAQLTGVKRTASDAKVDDMINIIYTVTTHPKSWVGPGEVPIPAENDNSVAYLSKTPAGDYAPAAGRMTFSDF